MPAPAPQTRPNRVRRWLRRGILALLTPVLFLALLLITARLYWSDARLQQWLQALGHDRLQATVTMESLHLSLWDGIELHDVHVGPLPGFTHDTLHIGRLAMYWDLAALWQRQVVLPEVAATGVRAAFEENQHGSNMEAIHRALAGPPAQAPAPSDTPSAPQPPRLPVEVRIDRLAVEVQELVVERVNQRASLTQVRMEGHFSGYGTALETSLWVGLGEPPPKTGASLLHAETLQPPQRVDVSQRLGVQVDSTGFGDLRLGLNWQADAQVHARAKTLAPVQMGAVVKIAGSLLTETVTLSQCNLTVGTPGGAPSVNVQLAAVLRQVLGTPQLEVQTLQGDVHLDSLQPLMAPWLPGTQVGGSVRLRLQPVQASMPALQGWQALSTQSTVETDHLTYRTGELAVVGLGSQTDITTQGGAVQVHSRIALDRAAQGAITAQGLSVDAQVETPLAPWLGGAVTGTVPVQATVKLARAQGPGFAAQDVRVQAQAQAPVALLQQKPGDVPLHAQVQAQAARASAASGALQGVRGQVTVDAWDLQATRLDAQVQAEVAQAQAALGTDTLRLPKLAAQVQAQRRGDSFDLREARLSAHDTWRVLVHGGVDGATGPAPTLRQVHLEMPSLPVAEVMATLPASLRPAADLGGSLTVTVDAAGSVPYQDLLAHSQAPALPTGPDDPDYDRALQRTVAWLQSWIDRLEHGLPLTAHTQMELVHGQYRDAAAEVQDLHVLQQADLLAHGPRYSLDVQTPHVRLQGRMLQGVRGHVNASWQGEDLQAQSTATITDVQAPDQPSPVHNANFVLDADYTWGGDLRVRQVALGAADGGLGVRVNGLVAQPLDVVLSRAWMHAGMPGAEARLNWQVGLHAPSAQPFHQGSLQFHGDFDLSGELRMNAGELALDGDVRMNQVHVEAATTTVEQMSGSLPVSLRLVFGQRDDSAVIAHNLGLGGGTLSVVTAEEDIRNRPARPVYYDRLRPYRPGVGLTALRIESGPYELLDFSLEARVVDGMFLADWFAMNVLGGDVVGNFALQLGRDSTLRSDVAVKASNVDASYLPALKLHPGPDSEMNADLRAGLLMAELGHDLTLNMNVTKIGAKALDRFLQLLDPAGNDAKLQSTRKNLQYVRIQEVAAWIRYENLNIDLAYDPILAIPFTHIGYRPIERELLRRYPVTDIWDTMIQPYVDKFVAPYVGWTHERS